MSEIDFDSFIAELERLGLKLTTIPLPDGTCRVNRWRTAEAIENAQQIEHLWATHIGDDKSRTLMLAVRLIARQRGLKATPDDALRRRHQPTASANITPLAPATGGV